MSNDELMHYGVKGMKWGHRKAQPYSAKATGHRVAAKVYELNEKTYRKSNPTLSSMNKHAKTQQLKAAEKAQEATNAKKERKRLEKSQKKSGNPMFLMIGIKHITMPPTKSILK